MWKGISGFKLAHGSQGRDGGGCESRARSGESQSRPERKEAGRCCPEGAGARKCHTHRTKYDLICGGTEVINDDRCRAVQGLRLVDIPAHALHVAVQRHQGALHNVWDHAQFFRLTQSFAP